MIVPNSLQHSQSGFHRTGYKGQVVAVILAGGEGRRLLPLTLHRAKPAVPFAGCCRIIDFTLSNCINSGLGLSRMVVITQYRPESVVNHLRPLYGELKHIGIELRSVYSNGNASWQPSRGTAGAVFQHLREILESEPEHILVLGSDHVYRMDYSTMLEFHRRAGSEATVASVNVELPQASSFGILSVDRQGVVYEFEEKPNTPKALPGDSAVARASMGVYLFNHDTLIEVLKQDAICLGSSHDFGRDIIPFLASQRRLCAFNFSNNDSGLSSYWRDVGTIDAYFQATMDILEPAGFPLHHPDWPLHSGHAVFGKGVFPVRDWRYAPAHSLVPVGCKVRLESVQRSVLFPGVVVGEGTELFETIVLPGAKIGRNVRAHRCIIEEGTEVPDNTRIGYEEAEDRSRYSISSCGVVVVHDNGIIGGNNDDNNSGSYEFGGGVRRAV